MWFMYVSIDIVWCPHPLQVHAQRHVRGREWYASALAMAGMQERYWYPAACHMCPVRLMDLWHNVYCSHTHLGHISWPRHSYRHNSLPEPSLPYSCMCLCLRLYCQWYGHQTTINNALVSKVCPKFNECLQYCTLCNLHQCIIMIHYILALWMRE